VPPGAHFKAKICIKVVIILNLSNNSNSSSVDEPAATSGNGSGDITSARWNLGHILYYLQKVKVLAYPEWIVGPRLALVTVVTDPVGGAVPTA